MLLFPKQCGSLQSALFVTDARSISEDVHGLYANPPFYMKDESVSIVSFGGARTNFMDA